MAMMPKRVKHRKQQRGQLRGNATRGNHIAYGEYGIQALELGWITARQIEAGRVAAQHFLGTAGKLWVRMFPWKPMTKKPAETRMGKGKAEPEFWVEAVRPGKILYELGGVPAEMARDALVRAAHKLSLRTRFVTRN